jgi:hypothetical protein
MRQAVEQVMGPDEALLGVWTTRGLGANALVCTSRRALVAKRAELVRWSVGSFPYGEIDSVEVWQGRPGSAVQVEIVQPQPQAGAPPKPGIFDDFPDAYYQESRRIVALNTIMFRSRRRAREAVESLQGLIVERGSA